MCSYIIDTSSILEQGFVAALDKLISGDDCARFYFYTYSDDDVRNFKAINKELSANTIKKCY